VCLWCSCVQSRTGQMAVRAFSLAGHLHMKTVGALSLLRSKKRYYFAIDELSGQLLYYKDEADLVAKREPIGTFPLANAAFTIVEGNDRAFVLHSSEKVVELEALNPESCECWLKALSHRALTSQQNRRRRIRSSRVRHERKRRFSGCEQGTVEEYNLVPLLIGRECEHFNSLTVCATTCTVFMYVYAIDS
uniref:PH domain-containing protein n=1 Tax=Haemonchus contortus TaxID=6289 RepID=A0A7I5EDS6_HAECO